MQAHAAWLGTQRLAIVGHSAGAAVAFEAARGMQEAGTPPALVILLDAAPWPATCELAARFDLKQTAVLSLRAEPSVWNKHAAVAELTRRIAPQPSRLLDLTVTASRHGDAMLSSWRLRLVGLCGAGASAIGRMVEAALLDVRDGDGTRLGTLVASLASEGAVTVHGASGGSLQPGTLGLDLAGANTTPRAEMAG